MSENSFSLTDQGKEVADKIPDLWFDWYGRLLPGALLILLGIWKYNLSTEKVTENIWLIFAAGYLIGHLLQPFSSGLLQWKYDDLKGSKSKKLSKLYSELVGFFSCFLGSVIFLI